MSISFSGWKNVHEGKHLKSHQAAKRGGIYMMYHGTHKTHATAIVRSGFRPSTNGLLGPGVYVSRNKAKAMCYPLTASDDDRVVFKLGVRVGKVKKIDRDNHPMQMSWHQNGYDTAWVPPKSGISTIRSGREEDCVWDPKRITIVGVSHCQDDQEKEELKRLIKKQARASSGRRSPGRSCRVCRKQMKGTHTVLDCWQCGKSICPFLDQHRCRRN
ncbi:uncharacterized protein [Ambystoma mexicanum]|uniref:uncharacterized protein n=1 Tax=Ambystoma mexicanum TaxID=8296 RepID=UPI0037E8B1E0